MSTLSRVKRILSGTLFGLPFMRFLEFIFLVLAGTITGVLLLAHGSIHFGPFSTEFSIKPSYSGSTKVELGPLGSMTFKSHSGPVSVLIKVNSLDPVTAEKWVNSKGDFKATPSDAGKNIRDSFTKIAVRALAGGMVLSFFLLAISFRRFKVALMGALLSLLLNLGVSSLAYVTYKPLAITQPKYNGLISAAPSLVGSAKEIATNFQQYRNQIAALLDNASKISNLSNDSLSYSIPENVIPVLHISDLHLNPAGWDMVNQLIKAYGVKVVVDSGDISDHGTSFEDSYLSEIPKLGVPYVYVRGNHDSKHTQNIISSYPNARVLDGGAGIMVEGIIFQGIGDPTFTPDKSLKQDEKNIFTAEQKFADSLAPMSSDVLVVHNPINAKAYDGKAALILSGHLHHRNTKKLSPNSLLMIQGSTGGGGLRMITNRSTPAKLEATILYFDSNTKTLIAYDEVSMGGLGSISAEINRKIPG